MYPVIYFIARKFCDMKISRFRGRVPKTPKLKCREKCISSSTEIKMHQKNRQWRRWWDFWAWTKFFWRIFKLYIWIEFSLYNVLVYSLRKGQKRVKITPFWNKQVISIFIFYLDREIKMQLNLYFCLNREIKMLRNAILTKNTSFPIR